MRDARAAFDRLYLRLVFERSQGSVKVTAASLGLNRTYVSELVKRYGLRLPAGSDDSPEA